MQIYSGINTIPSEPIVALLRGVSTFTWNRKELILMTTPGKNSLRQETDRF